MPYQQALEIMTDKIQKLDDRVVAVYSVTHSSQATSAVLPLLDLLKNSQEPVGLRTVIASRLLWLNDSRANAELLNVVSDSETPEEIRIEILTRGNSAGITNAATKIIVDVTSSEALLKVAIKNVSLQKHKTAVLPLLDRLKSTKNSEIQVAVIKALGEIASDRALVVLDTPTYRDSTDDKIKQVSRAAIEKIQTASNLDGLKTGNAASFEWAKSIIMYNNGAKKALMMEILQLWMNPKLPAAARIQVRLFVKSEIKSGYHDYDSELIAKMKEVEKL